MDENERLKADILRLIEGREGDWRSTAFYSDPKVSAIVARLHEEWERNGRRGIPLDYATIDELRVMASAASKYMSMSEGAARAVAMSSWGGGGEEGEDRDSGLLGFLRRLLGLRGGK